MAECTKTTRKNMINIVTNVKYHIRDQIISQTITRLRSRISYILRRKVDILVLEQVADELRSSLLKNCTVEYNKPQNKKEIT